MSQQRWPEEQPKPTRAQLTASQRPAPQVAAGEEENEPTGDYPLWPAALAFVLIVGAAVVLYLHTPDPVVFNAVIINVVVISVIAVWFGWGIALLVGGVASDSGKQLLCGALVIASSIAVPYMLLISGIFNLLNR